MSKPAYRVLVVDDDPADCKLIADLLQESTRATFVVDHAGNQQEARDLLLKEDGDYDVLMLDHNLGSETGIDLMIELQAELPGTPVIIMTGYGDVGMQNRAIAAGASDFLTKRTFTSELLERTLLYVMATGGHRDMGKDPRNDPWHVLIRLTEKSVQAQTETKNEIQALRGDLRLEVGQMRSDLETLKGTVEAHHSEAQANHRAAMEVINTISLPRWQRVLNWAVAHPALGLGVTVVVIAFLAVLVLVTQTIDVSVLRLMRP